MHSSILSYDLKREGSDDLFIGWGQWHGNSAALIELHDGVPMSPTANTTVARQGRAHTTPAACLTGNVGRTRLALSRLGTSTTHLIAVSDRTQAASEKEYCFTTDYGIRVWPLDPAFVPGEASIFFEPADSKAVAAGTMGGRDVFAVASLDDPIEADRFNWRLRLYGMHEQRIEALWEAKFYDTAWASTNMIIVDVNGNGATELVMTAGNEEVLVFALRE